MTAALLYQPPKMWYFWAAFTCAIALHLLAVSISWSAAEFASSYVPPGDRGPVETTDPADEPAQPPMELMLVEPSEVATPQTEFSDIQPESSPIQRRPWKPVPNPARTKGSGPSVGSVRSMAVYAPKPAYPYEARKRRITGTGVAFLVVDPSGNVVAARMAQSTGSVVLDNSAVSGLRMWRFKPGAISTVRVPITYTLSGASY